MQRSLELRSVMNKIQRQLARTWNSNEAGLLWERDWFVADDGSYRSRHYASGVFGVPDVVYRDEAELMLAFEKERARFYGRRFES